MKNIEELERSYEEAQSDNRLAGQEKLAAYRSIYDGIHAIEKASMRAWADNSVSRQELLRARDLLPQVEASINRMVAALRRIE